MYAIAEGISVSFAERPRDRYSNVPVSSDGHLKSQIPAMGLVDREGIQLGKSVRLLLMKKCKMVIILLLK